MKVSGIDFLHRRGGTQPYVAKDYAEFTSFALQCGSAGIARFVNDVFYDTSSQTAVVNCAKGTSRYAPEVQEIEIIMNRCFSQCEFGDFFDDQKPSFDGPPKGDFF